MNSRNERDSLVELANSALLLGDWFAPPIGTIVSYVNEFSHNRKRGRVIGYTYRSGTLEIQVSMNEQNQYYWLWLERARAWNLEIVSIPVTAFDPFEHWPRPKLDAG